MVQRVVVKGIIKRFGATLALRGVDAEFTVGLNVIEGANGSGKSTLLGVIGGVIRATAGNVTYEPLPDGGDVRTVLGWVSHDSLTYGDLTGRQNIELAAEAHGLDAGAAWADTQERFGLRGFAERKVRTHSRGQRQRVALARALVHRPSLVFLDEPTTGLDAEGIQRLLSILKEEIRREAVVIVVTHEPELFMALGYRGVRLERGRVADVSRETE